MMVHLLQSIPETDAYRCYLDDKPPLAWLLGRAVYLESYWTQQVVQGDEAITSKVVHLFGTGVEFRHALMSQLPQRDHLVNWALEQQEENLTLLANPTQLSQHPLVEQQRLLPLILNQQAHLYDQMLAQLMQRQYESERGYTVQTPLVVIPPSEDHADLFQGHFRVGAKAEDSLAYADELPTQIVELSAFRIDRYPVLNGAYLGFMRAGGYSDQQWWSEAGWQWLSTTKSQHPHYWKKDILGNYYQIGLNGAVDLITNEAICGLNYFEAEAYSGWVAAHGGRLAGAVVQHEYQWEVAARSGELLQRGESWEWCANAYHPYTGYEQSNDPELVIAQFGNTDYYSLRGGACLSQKILRRSSARTYGKAEWGYLQSSTRLVFPPSKMEWEK